ncbi:MAG: CDP-alcohol phosphatidyltransferase family protein [Rhodospirillales bacterium]|nr:MAG: CDP-alcohol phosphatidyltransferase family protein [Rhodospirillales bacterium]
MRVWIDAAAGRDAPTLFGMSPLERHVRAALKAGVAAGDILIDSGDAPPPSLPEGVGLPPVRIGPSPGDVAARLAAYLAAGGGPVFAVSGDRVVDPRLFAQAAKLDGVVALGDAAEVPRALPELWSTLYGAWDPRGEAGDLCLLVTPGTTLPPATSVAALAGALVAAGAARAPAAGEFDAHLAVQRRDVPFWVRRVDTPARRDAVERFMFDASYKGSTDVFTRYVYPFLVWPMTRLATRWRVHPNTITWVSIAATFAAVPCFAAGWWVAGFFLAYVMSVLDSVDGKVARVTFTASPLGNVLDHGLDIVHPPFWYAAWALGLSGLPWALAWEQGAIQRDPLFLWTCALIVLYVADRHVLAVYKAVHGRGLHAHAAIDRIARGLISRRNVNLPLFLVGLAAGYGRETFALIVVWQGLTVVWHVLRTIWILARRERPQGTV